MVRYGLVWSGQRRHFSLAQSSSLSLLRYPLFTYSALDSFPSSDHSGNGSSLSSWSTDLPFIIVSFLFFTKAYLSRDLYHMGQVCDSPSLPSSLNSVLLFRKQNPNSAHRFYYSLLPSSLPSCPAFWSDDDLYLLLGSYLLIQTEERKVNLARDYDEAVRVCPVFASLCSQQEFLLLRMIVASRNFSIEINGTTVSEDTPTPLSSLLTSLLSSD
jgi:hypothetical protein